MYFFFYLPNKTSRKTLQIICKALHNNNFNLHLNEQTVTEEIHAQTPGNHLCVVLSVSTMTDYEQLLASKMEREAAKAQLNEEIKFQSSISF